MKEKSIGYQLAFGTRYLARPALESGSTRATFVPIGVCVGMTTIPPFRGFFYENWNFSRWLPAALRGRPKG